MLLDIHSVKMDIIKIQQRAELKCIYINYKIIVDNVPVYLSVFRYEPNTLRNTLTRPRINAAQVRTLVRELVVSDIFSVFE
jgi:hypothetical protein